MMEKSHTNPKKIALVTGGTRGIGLSITKRLHELGYIVVVNGITSKILPKNITDNSSRLNELIYIQADISKKEDRNKIVKCIRETYNRLDVLVNNAGVAPLERIDLLNSTEESYDRVMNINLKGPYFLTQSVANFMIELKQNENISKYNPMIINISSISAYTSSIYRAEYCISKAGMSMMTQLYADRLAEHNIPVYEIRPGIIETDMTLGVKDLYDKKIKEGLLPIKRWGSPDDVANAVQSIVEGKFLYSTGLIFDIDGGFHLRRL